MFCTNCGAKIADGSAFCSMCGSRQPVVPSPMEEQLHQPQVEPAQESPYGQESTVESVQESPYGQESAYTQPNYGQEYMSYAQTQELQKKKKSPLAFILIGFISLLVIGGLVMAYFAFIKKPKDEIVGNYKVVAVNIMGYNIDPKLGDPDGSLGDTVEIDIMYDGDGLIFYSGNSQDINWKLDGINLTITGKNGKPLDDFIGGSIGERLEYRDGRIWCIVDDNGGKVGTMGALILARDGDDLSDLDIKSGFDVLQKIFGS